MHAPLAHRIATLRYLWFDPSVWLILRQSHVVNKIVTICFNTLINPLRPVAISKQLEMTGRSDYILACLIATALHSNINQTAGSGGHQSM